MQNIRFGEMESKALFALEEREAGIITLGQLAAMLRLTHVQAWGLASRLVRKHRLIRLKRGTYLFAPMKAGPKGEWSEDALGAVPKLMEGREYYVGFWAALSHYGLTEQIPLNIQLVTRGQQRHFRALQTSFEFVQVRRLGEWKMEKIGAHDVKMATVEQLILDCLSMPEKCGGVKMACQAMVGFRARRQELPLRQCGRNLRERRLLQSRVPDFAAAALPDPGSGGRVARCHAFAARDRLPHGRPR